MDSQADRCTFAYTRALCGHVEHDTEAGQIHVGVSQDMSSKIGEYTET